jgi:hypothetical protein
VKAEPLTAWDEPAGDDGCAYIVENGRVASCGEVTLPGSSYCLVHHELCYVRHGSKLEARKIQNLDRIADFLGCRKSAGNGPSAAYLRRLQRVGDAVS